MQILIVGCGLGGITAARALNLRGLDVTIIEQAPAPGEVGAGLQVPPNATRILAELGALDRVREAGTRPQHRIVRQGLNGAEIHRKELGDAVERVTGAPYLVLHRADFLDALLATTLSPNEDRPAVSIAFGERVNDIEDLGDRVHVRAESGKTWTADLVIGADGVHSTVRRAIGEIDSAVYSGESMWRALIPAQRLENDLHEIAGLDGPATTVWTGPRRHVVNYPLRGGRMINVAATIPGHEIEESYSTSGNVEDFVASFEGWDARLLRLFGHAEEVKLWPLFAREPLQRWTSGRIALLGDAAHPMLPYQAQGSAQAIEDAAVLAECLVSAPEDIPGALRQYETLRKPRASAVQAAAVRSGETWGVSENERLTERNAQLQAAGGNSGSLTYDWLWDGSPSEAPLEVPS